MGKVEWCCYEPPTKKDLERRQKIRDRVEELSNRPLVDHGPLQNCEIVVLKPSLTSGLVLLFACGVGLFVTLSLLEAWL